MPLSLPASGVHAEWGMDAQEEKAALRKRAAIAGDRAAAAAAAVSPEKKVRWPWGLWFGAGCSAAVPCPGQRAWMKGRVPG